MTKKKKQMWTELELKGLLEDEDSCVYWEKVQEHLTLHPAQLKNNTVTLNEKLTTKINFYDNKLDGFPLLYQNPKLLTELGNEVPDLCFLHIDIEVEYYIFRPAVGRHLKGIVTKKAINHIRVLVHRAFSVAIQKPPNTEDWVGHKVQVGQEIKFTVTHLDYDFKYPVFKGTLDPDNYLDGCQLFDESKNEQVDEKPILDSLNVIKKKKKTNDSSENEDTQVVKKSKKKKNDINIEESTETPESKTDISAHLKHRSIKLEKVSNLEGTAKVQSNATNHEQTDENHQESPKKKSKHHGDEYNIVGESKADLKKYKKQLHETLPDLTVNTDEPDSTEKKKKKRKRDKSKERNTSFEDHDTSTAVDNSVPISDVSRVSNVADCNTELHTGLTSLDQHDNAEEEFVKRKTKKKKKEKELSQDPEMQYTSETEKEYKKRLKKQILIETAGNHEMQEGGVGEEQVSMKKSKKRKNTEHEDEDSMIADFCHSETEKNYKKKLHKGLFSSTMIEDGESNFTNPEESEAEKKSKKELQNQLFKSPLKKSPKKSKKSNNWDITVPQLNISYPDSDDSCFSDNKEKMKKYKKALRISLAIDDSEETEAQPSPKKKSKKRKMNDGHDEAAGAKVQIDKNCQPVFLTPKLEDAKPSKKSSGSSLNEENSICFEDRFPGSKAVTKPNQTLTPPSSDSDNVTINQSSNKKTKKVSSPSKAASKTDLGVTTSKPIKKEKD